VKLDATGGGSLWPAPATSHGDYRVAKSLGFDSSGNLFLGAASGGDLATVVYDGASGGELLRTVLPAGATGSAVDLKMLGDDPVLLSGSEGGLLLVRYTRRLGIETLAESVPPAYCGRAYQFPLVGRNGSPPYQWNVVSGSLPPGLILDRDRVTGEAVITGTPTGIGTFTFRLRLRDSATPHKAEAFRDYTISVYDGEGFVTVASSMNPVCLGATTTLSVPGVWSSYRWLPGGETTPTLDVSPSNPTTYGVVVTEQGGCTRRGAVTVSVVPNRPAVTAPPSATILQTSCSP